MDENECEDHEGRNPWLEEHESIQKDLMMIKDDMEREKSETKKEDVPTEIHEKNKEISKKSDQVIASGGETRKPTHQQEPTIKELLTGHGSPDKKAKSRLSEEKQEGDLPKHPELSSYIARVIEHESKIKRRMFEREKAHRVGPQKSEPITKEGDDSDLQVDDGKSSEPIDEDDFLLEDLGLKKRSGKDKSHRTKSKKVGDEEEIEDTKKGGFDEKYEEDEDKKKPIIRKKIVKRIKMMFGGGK